MASSYSSDLKLELMVTGENAGTWGTNTNNNLNLIQQAIAGYEQVTLSSGGTLALAMTDKTISNARNMVIKFATASIAASTICTIPDSIEKFYIFDATGLTNPANLTIKTASGTGFTLDAAKIYAAYSDGTNLKEISLDTLGGTVGSAQIADDAVGNDQIADDAVRAANISDNAVVTAVINDDAVTYAKMQNLGTGNRVLGAATAGAIGEVQVATDMIADDAVTADKLANTTVSAGTYATATITVDAQGRLTAAAEGSGGGANMRPIAFANSGGTGNYTAHPSVTVTHLYAKGGTGGSGGNNMGRGGGGGGQGAFGFWSIPVSSHPYSAPYAAANAGSGGGPMSAGTAGGASTFAHPGTTYAANGGNGGTRGMTNFSGSPGSAGTLSPSASETFTGNSAAEITLLGQPSTAGAIAIYDNEG